MTNPVAALIINDDAQIKFVFPAHFMKNHMEQRTVFSSDVRGSILYKLRKPHICGGRRETDEEEKIWQLR
jgi:hypothetical protein